MKHIQIASEKEHKIRCATIMTHHAGSWALGHSHLRQHRLAQNPELNSEHRTLTVSHVPRRIRVPAPALNGLQIDGTFHQHVRHWLRIAHLVGPVICTHPLSIELGAAEDLVLSLQ